MRASRRGFTLLEIMVVIALIAMLGGAVAVGLLRSSNNAKRSAAKTNTISLAQVAEAFMATKGTQRCPTPKELKEDGPPESSLQNHRPMGNALPASV